MTNFTEIYMILFNDTEAVKVFQYELKCPGLTTFLYFFKLSMNNFNKELTAKTLSHEYDEDEN